MQMLYVDHAGHECCLGPSLRDFVMGFFSVRGSVIPPWISFAFLGFFVWFAGFPLSRGSRTPNPIAWWILPTGLAIIFMLFVQTTLIPTTAKLYIRRSLRKDLCPSCGYELKWAIRCDDRLSKCIECGASWNWPS